MDTLMSFAKENFQLITLFVGLLGVLVSIWAVYYEIKKRRKNEPKKRKTSKFQYLTRRVAIVSAFTISIFALILVPMFTRLNKVNAVNENQVTNIGEEYEKQGQVDVNEIIDNPELNDID